jgi:hypothetical protein
MTSRHHRQRGEGKVGCIVSLLVFVIVVGIAVKAVPVYWADNELKDAAKDLASRAASIPPEGITLQMRSKAQELGIAEALMPGAIRTTKSASFQQGLCSIYLKYKRDIDFYGAYKWTDDVDITISAPYMSGL